jgi:hypothetical protein
MVFNRSSLLLSLSFRCIFTNSRNAFGLSGSFCSTNSYPYACCFNISSGDWVAFLGGCWTVYSKLGISAKYCTGEDIIDNGLSHLECSAMYSFSELLIYFLFCVIVATCKPHVLRIPISPSATNNIETI